MAKKSERFKKQSAGAIPAAGEQFHSADVIAGDSESEYFSPGSEMSFGGESVPMEQEKTEQSPAAETFDRDQFDTAAELIAAGDHQGEEAAGDSIEVHDDGETGPEVPLRAAVSALLFVSSKPLTIETLARASRATTEDVAEVLALLSAELTADAFGFVLVEVAGAYQLRSAPSLAVVVKRLVRQRDRRLSRAAAETLAVVAYKQPVGRAEIEAIRGVDALPTLKTLLDAKLVRIVGRDSSVGHPALFGTTDRFLERFGLADLSELMSVKEVEQLVRDPGEGDSDSETSPAGPTDPIHTAAAGSEMADSPSPAGLG